MTSTLYRGYELTDGQFAAIHICVPSDGYVTATASSVEQACAIVDAWHAGWRSYLADTNAEYRYAAFQAILACGEFE